MSMIMQITTALTEISCRFFATWVRKLLAWKGIEPPTLESLATKLHQPLKLNKDGLVLFPNEKNLQCTETNKS